MDPEQINEQQMELQTLAHYHTAMTNVSTTMDNLTHLCFEKCIDFKNTDKQYIDEVEGNCVINCTNGIIAANSLLMNETFRSVGMFKL